MFKRISHAECPGAEIKQQPVASAHDTELKLACGIITIGIPADNLLSVQFGIDAEIDMIGKWPIVLPRRGTGRCAGNAGTSAEEGAEYRKAPLSDAFYHRNFRFFGLNIPVFGPAPGRRGAKGRQIIEISVRDIQTCDGAAQFVDRFRRLRLIAGRFQDANLERPVNRQALPRRVARPPVQGIGNQTEDRDIASAA
ncbi:hypothetical protein [Roseibium sp.]|uniref:hypothetical protein n=1 Tax=Roseibium sp. TaxID=1936156 RepID=UPI003A96DDA0